ncbi:thiamine pyrophosphokinase 1 [Bemisia tabaci]|uniref:thiamine pyrophosphokinase 1 n=1 Tax=Bemisia tabaci TaxID=7038 RepID=UPI003B283620
MNELNVPSLEWDPVTLLFDHAAEFPPAAIVVLNTPILLRPEVVCSLWNRAIRRVTVDGGTNHWLRFAEENGKLIENKYPHLITGDMDSIEPDLLSQCQKEKSEVLNTPNQLKTDFHKALDCIASSNNNAVDVVFVLAEHSGRVDQILSNLSTLHQTSKIFKRDVPVFIVASDTVTWVLNPGVQHRIHVADRLIESQSNCGLIPLAGVASHITTTGLKWNLTDQGLEFGNKISSSNTYSGSSIVTVETDTQLVWSMSLGLTKKRD